VGTAVSLVCKHTWAGRGVHTAGLGYRGTLPIVQACPLGRKPRVALKCSGGLLVKNTPQGCCVVTCIGALYMALSAMLFDSAHIHCMA
jgi:hypothetical protein